ncbi:MAG: SLBB domain-containing protein [Alphaproteobacteria bacterium]|nr:SLBB domain-containing protein [Alphaproteobacteria bacterium]
MLRHVILMLLTFAVALTSAAAAQENDRKATTRPPQPAVSAHYRVGEGDVLHVEIYGEEDMSGTYAVGPGGVLNYPMLENFVVTNDTVDRISERMADALEVNLLEDPRVTVRVEQCLSQRVYVLGSVNTPGEFYLCGPTTLLDVLARAGGVTDENVTRVIVRRDAQPEREINYDALINQGLDNVELSAEDRIYVPEGVVVYVTGQVQQPGAVPFRKGMTITQAVTQAGGLTEIARTRKVHVLRGGQRIDVRLKRIFAGREPDFELQPDDQVNITEGWI